MDVPVAIASNPLPWLLPLRTIPTSCPLMFHPSVSQGCRPQRCALHARKVGFEEWFLDQQHHLGTC